MAHTLLQNEAPQALAPNLIYQILNRQFIRVFDDFDGDAMIDSCYVTQPTEVDDAVDEDEIIDSAMRADPLYGSIARDVLMFALSSSNSTLVVTGGVGSGKTAAFKSINALCRRHNKLGQRIHLLMVNFNAKKSELEDAADAGPEKMRKVVRKIVFRQVVSRLEEIVGDRKEFFESAWREDEYFAAYRIASDVSLFETHEERKKYRNQRLKEYVEDVAFIYHLALYAQKKHNITMLLVLDNIDPLDRVAHQSLVWLAEELFARGGFRVVLSMRDNTRKAIAPDIDALAPLTVRLSYPNIAMIMEKRAEFLVANCRQLKTRETIRRQLEKYQLSHIDADELIPLFIEAALPGPVLDDLARLSNQNARTAMEMARAHFASPYIHSERIADVMRALHNDVHHHRHNEPEIPSHVFLQSVVTDNHATFSGQSRFPTITNVWGDHFGCGTHASHFTGLLVLNAAERLPNHSTIGSIENVIQRVFGRINELREEYQSTVHPWVLKLINSRLIATPEFLHKRDAQALGTNCEIQISMCGQFYLYELAYRLEYFGYVKDAIPTRKRVRAVSTVTHPQLSRRIVNSLLMVEYLLEEEIAWYDTIRKDIESWERFKDDLAFQDADGDPELLAQRFIKYFEPLKSEHPQYFSSQADDILERIRRMEASARKVFEH